MKMHRTQISLEPVQVRRLQSRAAEEQVSLAELIRRLIDRFLGEGVPSRPLESFAGSLTDKECQSADIKGYLYPSG